MSTTRTLVPAGLVLATLLLAGAHARAEEVTYEIKKTAVPATAGVASSVSVTVVGKNGWHVNDEAPITVAVKGEGVTLPKEKLTRADLAESTKQSARFDIPFSAAEAGKKTITAQARFVMCQEQACKPASETVAFEIDVQAPGAKKDLPAAKPSKRPAKRAATP
jgi:hypothetical protein